MNTLVLRALIAEIDALRYTPAGIPALGLRLENESQVQEEGQSRRVQLSIKAVAFGTLAESLAKQAIGSVGEFHGFLSNARQGKSIVFHIQQYSQN